MRLSSILNTRPFCDQVLTADLKSWGSYFKYRCLHPNDAKTEVSMFHFNYHMAKHQLSTTLNGTTLRYNPTPKYF